MKFLILTVLIGLFFFLSSRVLAHPIDEISGTKIYDQVQTLSVGSRAELTIDLTIYAVEKNRIWESIDLDRNRLISEEEKSRWLNLGLKSSYLTDKQGGRIDFDPIRMVFPDYDDFFSPDPVKIRLSFISNTGLKNRQNYIYNYFGKDKPLSDITLKIMGSDGISAANIKPVDKNSVSFDLIPGTVNSTETFNFSRNSRLNGFLNKYVKTTSLSSGVLYLALAAAFFIGALHALTPGHGKALVAGYLVGEQGKILHAVELGIIITATHTFSVFLLGFVAIFLARYIVPLTLIKQINLLSGLLVTAFGIYLFITRLRKLHSETEIKHEHIHSQPELTLKNLLPLGISGGLVPCIDALAILLVAVSVQKILLGMLFIVFFSFGLATALVSAGIAVIFSKNQIVRKLPDHEKFEKRISLVSAAIVTLLGISILFGK